MVAAARDQVTTLGPWKRGLNNATPPPLLAPDELVRADDVEIDAAGAVRCRQPIQSFLTLPNGYRCIYAAPTPGQFRSVSSDAGILIAYVSGTALKAAYAAEPQAGATAADLSKFSEITFPRAYGDTTLHAPMPSHAAIGETLYMCWAGRVVRLTAPGTGSDDGTFILVDDLGPGDWNDDYENPEGDIWSPTSGKFPFSAALGSYQNGGSEWALAGFFDTIRWSHPLSPDQRTGPEDWAEDDYIRIETDPPDQTIGFVQFRDQVLVLKTHSIWVLYGREPAQWRVLPVTSTFGVPHAGCATVTPVGVVMTDGSRILVWDGSSLRDLVSGRLDVDPTSHVPETTYRAVQGMSVGYYDDVVYVSMPIQHTSWNVGGGFGPGFGPGYSHGGSAVPDGPYTTYAINIRTGALVSRSHGASCWFSMRYPALHKDDEQPDHGLLFVPAYAASYDSTAFATTPDLAGRVPPRVRSVSSRSHDCTDEIGPAAFRKYIPRIETAPAGTNPPDTIARWRNSQLRIQTGQGGGNMDVHYVVDGARQTVITLPVSSSPGIIQDMQMGPTTEGVLCAIDAVLPPDATALYALMRYWPDRRRL